MSCKPILLIEGDEHVRDSMTALLEEEGYQVEQARDGLEALARLDRGGYGMVLLGMPAPNDWEFLEECHHRLPIVLLSAGFHWTPDVDAFLRKPVQLGELLPLVERFCGYADRPAPEPTGAEYGS